MIKQRTVVSSEVVSSTGQRIPIVKLFDMKGTIQPVLRCTKPQEGMETI